MKNIQLLLGLDRRLDSLMPKESNARSAEINNIRTPIKMALADLEHGDEVEDIEGLIESIRIRVEALEARSEENDEEYYARYYRTH